MNKLGFWETFRVVSMTERHNVHFRVRPGLARESRNRGQSPTAKMLQSDPSAAPHHVTRFEFGSVSVKVALKTRQ